jgi:hypothetical protein
MLSWAGVRLWYDEIVCKYRKRAEDINKYVIWGGTYNNIQFPEMS